MASCTPDGLLPIVVLISGRGSNLQAIIESIRNHQLPVEVRAVISNRRGAQGLEHAHYAGLPTATLEHGAFHSRGEFDEALCRLIDSFSPRLVVLAGFMRLLSAAFVAHYEGRIINIHPSLLPAYRGLNTHQRALNDRACEHGASVHYVTAELDDGPVIIQGRVPVLRGDSVDTLADRVLEQEHRIYPLAIRWIAEGRLAMKHNTVYFNGEPLSAPHQLAYNRDDDRR